MENCSFQHLNDCSCWNLCPHRHNYWTCFWVDWWMHGEHLCNRIHNVATSCIPSPSLSYLDHLKFCQTVITIVQLLSFRCYVSFPEFNCINLISVLWYQLSLMSRTILPNKCRRLVEVLCPPAISTSSLTISLLPSPFVFLIFTTILLSLLCHWKQQWNSHGDWEKGSREELEHTCSLILHSTGQENFFKRTFKYYIATMQSAVIHSTFLFCNTCGPSVTLWLFPEVLLCHWICQQMYQSMTENEADGIEIVILHNYIMQVLQNIRI